MKEAFYEIKWKIGMLTAMKEELYKRKDRNELQYMYEINILKEVMNIVSEVEAEYGNGWIPCIERLPEKSGRVLVSYESINDEIAVSETSYDYKRKTFWISPCVIAWMPLPEAYKPEKGGD